MADINISNPLSQGASASYCKAVSKSDTVDEIKVNGKFPAGLLTDAAGAVSLVNLNGDIVTFPSGMIAAGVVYPIKFRRIRSTGTGTQNIVVLWD